MWTTNENRGTETVIDAGSAAARGTVDLGGEVGNVGYDPAIDRMLVAVQGRGDLAVIDPATPAQGRRLWAATATPSWCRSTSPPAASPAATPSGGPDVLAYDPGAHRLYVAAESGVERPCGC
ncbi:hypothetical protein [Mycolicibacterium sphagni]|uniref:hypothetical protein n=1 Tax=Mycolicibacterium sphagni TaxID=1786 RepID=UPI001F03C936|nr:hypothetical protein [Mycolicibacterium sphagni]